MLVLSVFLIVTAAFGNQYLLWPLPLMFALGGWARVPYTVAATAWAGIAYLTHWPVTNTVAFLAALSWLVIATLTWLMWSAGQGLGAAMKPRFWGSPPLTDSRSLGSVP
jgi:hypothetical protein